MQDCACSPLHCRAAPFHSYSPASKVGLALLRSETRTRAWGALHPRDLVRTALLP